jgi:hypothetical protein
MKKALEICAGCNPVSACNVDCGIRDSSTADNLQIKAKIAFFRPRVDSCFIGHDGGAFEHGNGRVKLDILQFIAIFQIIYSRFVIF